jgi:hypothetical protein
MLNRTSRSNIFFITVAWALWMTQATVVYAQSNIKSLTSGKAAEEASKEIPHEGSSPSDDNILKLHSLGVGLGQTFLNGDFEASGDDSITADLYYSYSASYSFDLVTNVHHSAHKLGNKKTELNGLAVGIKGKGYQFDSFSPFILGGLGFYDPRVTREVNGSLKKSKSKVVFGTHFGLGVELRLNRHFLLTIMAHYHNPFDVKQELDPEIEGSYHKLLIILSYSF